MKKLLLRAAALIMVMTLFAAAACAELKKGDQGEDVAELQRMLIEMGFLDDTADGAYGSNTESAVRLFQTYCGLKETGKADDTLLSMVFDLYATAFGVMEDDALAAAEHKDQYPAACAFEGKDEWKAVYCWRHADQGYLSGLIYRPGAPARLVSILTRRGCEKWLKAISVMFAEWEATLPAEERAAAAERRTAFETTSQGLLAGRLDDGSEESLLNAFVYLEEYGIELCHELYGE